MIYTINPPIWRFSKSGTGKVIIAIDRQKHWERVIDYRDRVIALFHARKMSERYDHRFMCRVFLGGLNQTILDIMLGDDDTEISFREAVFHAEFLEDALERDAAERMEEDDDEAAADWEGPGGGTRDDIGVENAADSGECSNAAARPRPSVIQDGEEIFGEPNEKVDKLFNGRYVLILYR